MTHETPLSPRPLADLADLAAGGRRLLTHAQLAAHGVTAAEARERCRPGGSWQLLLPDVVLLHPGPPTGEERLRAALLHAGPGAMVTGLAALALHGFPAAPPPAFLETLDVLVPRGARRLRSAGWARIVRSAALPTAEEAGGVPVAPVARALADAVGRLTDAVAVRRLLTEAVRGGHCEAAAVVRELSRARLLGRPHVVDAVDSLAAEGRSLAEGHLYRMVREHGLPEPVWNVDLRLPGGPHLGGLDAYWPEQAVAVDLDTRDRRRADDALWAEQARKREHLERLGITVVHLTPRSLREHPEQQATVVRTALAAAVDREPAAYVVVLPR
ncbi:hypothetical protein ACGFZL_02495 [Streptomyces sp. NPDC048182]|uniref:hypothetical protein n=1 Tax=Streptomyces sp. NPDC048182 TaxID=3365507 RepID=UPI003717AA7A